MKRTVVFAKFPQEYNGKQLDRGEIITTEECKNDEKLVGLGFLILYDSKKHGLKKCLNCSRGFITEGFLYAHKKKPNCNAEQGEPSRVEIAEVCDKDPATFSMDEAKGVVIDPQVETSR
jgi:hypothetical protein